MLDTMLRRLRTQLPLGLAFAFAGALLNCGVTLIVRLQAPGTHSSSDVLLHWLQHNWLPSMEGALIIMLCLRLSTERGSDLARRPLRFGVVLVAGATLSTLLQWSIAAATGRAPLIGDAALLPELLDTWQQAMYCGTLVGWLYILTLRRIEQRTEFVLLLARRSILRRQLSHKTLMARRAQVDPEQVARVLAQIRQRHLAAPLAAAGLLDQLISYLRLVMHRTRAEAPSLLAELSLVRAYLSLCEAEFAIPVTWDEQHMAGASDSAGRQPIFLAVRQLLALALAGGAARVDLSLQWQAKGIMLRLDVGPAVLPAHAADSMAPYAAPLRHVHENGVNYYVAKIDGA